MAFASDFAGFSEDFQGFFGIFGILMIFQDFSGFLEFPFFQRLLSLIRFLTVFLGTVCLTRIADTSIEFARFRTKTKIE